MAMAAARECLDGTCAARTVFASRHGDLSRTVELLDSLCAGEELSPTSFSLSVHNTVPGLESIVRRDRSPATAVGAGDESLAYGLLEALTQLAAHPDLPVLMIYADEPVPPEYRPYVEYEDYPHALAILFRQGAERRAQMAWRPGAGGTTVESQSLSFLRFLASDQAMCEWRGERTIWTWTRC